MKLLSIIVPTYNMEALLEKNLNSLVLETEEQRAKLDIIVVNDGSKDRSSEIAHQFAERYPEEFRVLDKKNGNYGSCINAALQVVAGKYVRIMDADDSYYTENLPAYLDVLEQQDADLVLSPYKRVNEVGQLIKNEPIMTAQVGGVNNPFSCIDGFFAMHQVAYRSSIFKHIDYHQTEGISYTDVEWVFQPMTEVRTAYIFDKPIYRYLFGRDEQTCNPTVRINRLDQDATVLKRQLDVLRSTPSSNPAYAYLKRFSEYHAWAIYGMALAKSSPLDIHSLDTLFKEYTELYNRTSDFTIDVGIFNLKFHFVRAWRKVGDRRKLKFFPLYALFLLMNRIHK